VWKEEEGRRRRSERGRRKVSVESQFLPSIMNVRFVWLLPGKSKDRI
jgi:hypothetical protein